MLTAALHWRSWIQFTWLDKLISDLHQISALPFLICHLLLPLNTSSALLQSVAWSATWTYHCNDKASAKHRRKDLLLSFSNFKHTTKTLITKLIRNLLAHHGKFPPDFNKNMCCSWGFYVSCFKVQSDGCFSFPFKGCIPIYYHGTGVVERIRGILEAQYNIMLLKVLW